MKSLNVIYLLALVCLSSCGTMKVDTTVTRTYPALKPNEPVLIYFDRAEVPKDPEVLGVVNAKDNGATPVYKCDSLSVVGYLKDEARKVGGNAVYVTNYTKPSYFGSNCHQMMGNILRVDESEVVAALEDDPEAYAEMNVVEEKKIYPRIRFSLDAGYGWRTASLKGLTGTDREFYQDMKSGLAFETSLAYYFHNNMGIGLTYAGYSANTGSRYTVDGDTKLHYMGVDYAVKQVFSDRWVFDMKVGMGYAGYKITYKEGRSQVSESGATFGTHLSLGFDYMIAENLAIGIGASLYSGVVKTVTIDDGVYKRKIEYKEINDGVGLGQIRLIAGIRAYIN